jgi:hypothetical protein
VAEKPYLLWLSVMTDTLSLLLVWADVITDVIIRIIERNNFDFIASQLLYGYTRIVCLSL